MIKNYKNFLQLLLGIGLFLTLSVSSMAQIQPIQHSTQITQPVHSQTLDASSVLPDSKANTTNNASEPCITDQITNEWLTKSGLKEKFQAAYQEAIQNINYSPSVERATYTIPIIFHVVHNTPSENLSNSEIMKLFNDLNDDFQLQNADRVNARSAYGFTPENANISFCLAQRDPSGNPLSEPGVNRVSTSETWFDNTTETNKMKNSTYGAQSWDRSRYLNVWICDITNGASSGVAGYAYLPYTTGLPPANIDGIVIDYNLGTTPGSHVLSHEVGHFLGLPHTWGQNQNCSSDDGIADTPMTQGPSHSFPGSCSGDQSTCGSTQTQYENFMDYSNCTCMFTQGQVSLMHQILNTSRTSLTTSDACTPVNPTPPVTDFTADITTVVSGGIVNFTDLSSNFPTSWTWNITPSTGWSYAGGTSATSKNPSVQFTTTGQYTIELTATNSIGSDLETKTNYITVVASGGGTVICDTLRNWTAADNMAVYTYQAPSSGYISGTGTLNGTINVLEIAEPYTVSSSSQVRSVRIAIDTVENNSGSGSVTFTVYQDNAGQPGVAITSETVPYSSIYLDAWNTIEFSSPATVNGTFWIGYSLSYGTPQDYFVPIMTQDRGSGSATTFLNLSGGVGWNSLSSLFAGGIYTSIYMDALVSTGPAPNAVLSISDNVTCKGSPVSMNGFSSTNTTDYFWLFDDGSQILYSYSGNITHDFAQGNWDVYLIAKGSCISDTTETTLTVNPAINGNPSVTDENCSNADGAISFNPTGGNGGPYDMSINSGATFVSSPPYNFTNLNSGTYTTILTDGTGCVDTFDVTVNKQTNINASVTPGTSINSTSGATVTLTAVGGTTWTWYEGLNVIGTSQSINVAPTVTTVYDLVVGDGTGCSESIQVTINIGTSGVEKESFNQMVSVYPNPSTGTFNLSFDLNKAQDIKIVVYDVVGSTVYESSIDKTEKAIVPVRLSDKDSGTYLIHITGEEGTITKRVILAK